jgi:hypothetical protein
MPILGIIASSFRSAAGPVGAYDALATVTVPSGGAANITFAGIPAGYKHLQLRMLLRGDRADVGDDIKIQFNSDTGNNYADHILSGNGSSAGTYAQSSFSMIYSYDGMPAANATANVFFAGIMDVLDYSSVTKNKTTRWLQGNDRNGAGSVGLTSGLWMNTSAINTVLIAPRYGSNFAQYSQIALYGVK